MIEQRRSNTGIPLIIAAMLFASISLSAQQQPERNGPPKPPCAVEVNKMIDELSTTLSLNESQKKEVSDLFTAHFNNMKESMGSREGSGSPEEMQQKRKDFEAQVKSLLNDEQKLAFDQFMKSRGPQPNQQMPKR